MAYRLDPLPSFEAELRQARHHAYYRVEDESRRVVFVRLWPAARGTPPTLE